LFVPMILFLFRASRVAWRVWWSEYRYRVCPEKKGAKRYRYWAGMTQSLSPDEYVMRPLHVRANLAAGSRNDIEKRKDESTIKLGAVCNAGKRLQGRR
jgi:hypothetical protein